MIHPLCIIIIILVQTKGDIMTLQNKDSIFGTVITVAEKLEGCKLEKSALGDLREQIQRLSEYLGTDEMSSVFFSVIFAIQNHRPDSAQTSNSFLA